MLVLVTYGRHSKTLSAVRSLGRSGREVVVTDSRKSPLSAYSKYCSHFVLTPSPKDEPQRFLKEIVETVNRFPVEAVVPMDDWECDLLSLNENRAKLGCQIMISSQESYEHARDKNKTLQLACELGIRTPKSVLLRKPDEIEQVVAEIGLPLVVKPVKGSGSRGFMLVKNQKKLLTFPKLMAEFGPMIAQEFIPSGGSLGVSYLMNDGDLRAVFSHKRLVEYPESGGPSIVRESVRHEEAEDAGRRLLESMRWNGVAMVEFRIDSRTSEPVLMEINPRFWGSLPLAIASGVDFPKLLCDMYEHGDVQKVLHYATGVKCVNLLPLGAMSVLGHNGLRRAREIARYSLQSRCFDVESIDDPWPSLGAVVSLFGYVGDRSKLESFFRAVQ
jgi:predicted ATP-grasp superfamily ATP-dependent carboligase